MSLEELKRKAVDFVNSIPRGGLTRDQVADDFSGWAGSAGDIDGDDYIGRVGVIVSIFVDGGLRITVDRVTAEGRSVAVQARGEGTLYNGDKYIQSYVFILEFNDEGKLRHVREYLDTAMVHKVLRPAIEAWHRQGKE